MESVHPTLELEPGLYRRLLKESADVFLCLSASGVVRRLGGAPWLFAQELLTAVHEDDRERARTSLGWLAVARESTLDAEDAQLAALRDAQRVGQVGSWRFDLTTGVVTWSDELYRIFAMEPRAVAPSFPDEQALLYEANDFSRLVAAVQRALETGEAYVLTMEARPVLGGRKWMLARGAVRRDGSGKIVQLSGTLQDITFVREQGAELIRSRVKLAQTDAELRTALALKRAIFEAAGVAIIVTDLDGRIVRWNTTAEQLTGYSAEEVLGQTPQVLHEPRELAQRLEELSTLRGQRVTEMGELFADVQGGSVNQREWTYVRKDGSTFPVLLSVTSLRDEYGVMSGYVAIGADISASREARAEVDRLSRRLAVATSRTGIGIWDLSITGAQLTWDDTMYELHGAARSAMDPREHWRQATVPEDLQRVVSAVEGARKTGSDVDLVYRVRTSLGVRHLRLHGTADRDESGALVRMLGTCWDVTAEQEREAALRRSNEDLQQFAYAASHDLQEPLRAVAGCAQILAEAYSGRLDASADELITHIVEGAQRMRTLIRDLLELSKVSTQSLGREPMDSGLACAEALSNLSVALQEATARVRVEALPAVFAQRALVAQLFQNLLGNAIKYRHESRTLEIEVSATSRADEVEFVVRDNGIGIEPRYFDRIFKVFQRLHTRVEYPGTGIGLALAQKIVERHGGRIWVESVFGEGSSFHFTLPSVSTARGTVVPPALEPR
jgi:PAS domain S-box-containing protein